MALGGPRLAVRATIQRLNGEALGYLASHRRAAGGGRRALTEIVQWQRHLVRIAPRPESLYLTCRLRTTTHIGCMTRHSAGCPGISEQSGICTQEHQVIIQVRVGQDKKAAGGIHTWQSWRGGDTCRHSRTERDCRLRRCGGDRRRCTASRSSRTPPAGRIGPGRYATHL